MKCIICHGEQFVTKTVQEEIKIEHDIVLTPVEAVVCQTCGERYFSPQTMRKVELVEKQVQRKEVPLREIGKVLITE